MSLRRENMRIKTIKMKNILALCICMLGTVAMSQTTAIPDANFEAQLIALGVDTNGQNGNILNTDAEAVIELVTGRDDITDFSGLQAFKNIKRIDLGRNQFTTLPLNQLAVLEELRFIDNVVLASLDLTKNLKLKILDIRSLGAINTSLIIELDLSQNVELESINIFNFQDLETITLPETKSLQSLTLVSNFDFSADMSFYDNLEVLNLQVPGVKVINLELPNNKNKLKLLRIVGGNINDFRGLVDYVNLEQITLQGPTEFIDFPITPTLKSIIIEPHLFTTPLSFDGLPQLEYLHIRSTPLTLPLDIDIRSNSELKTLILSQNNMVNLNLEGNPKIVSLQVHENNMETIDLTKNPNLENLNIKRNLLRNIDLRNNTKLINLALNENRLTSLDLTNNSKLVNVDISKNLLTGAGPDLSQNIDIVRFDISNNKISTIDITQNLKLVYTNLSFNKLSGNDILQQIVQNYQAAGKSLGAETYLLNDNLLSNEMPDFTALVNGATKNFSLSIHNNNFHFGDLEARHQQYVNYTNTANGDGPIFKNYSYAGQSKVNVREVITTTAGEPITLATVVRGSQNHYKWFKDGVEIAGAADAPEYTIPAPEACESGVYYAEITSDLMPFEDANGPGANGKNLLLQRNDIVLGANGAPTCAILVNPLNKAIDIPINTGIEWESESGACGYLLSVGTTAGATDILDAEDVGNVSGYNFENNLPSNAEIFVTITPYFENGPLTGCREESFFTNAESTVPECSILTQPLNGSVGVNPQTNINWSVASGAEGYRLKIGTTSGGSDLANVNIEDGLTTYDPPVDFQLNAEVFVTITPFNAEGDAIGCAEGSFFVSEADQIPPCTNMTRPVNGEIDVNTNTIIRWNRVGNANGYVLNIGRTEFGTDILSRDVGSEIEFQLDDNLPPSTTIFVTIIPYNTQGNATACVSDSFTTADIVPIPECTSLITPENGERDVDPSINLAWNAAEYAEGYRLVVGTTPEGDEFFSQDVGLTTFYNFPEDLPEGSPIYVTVTPYNETGDAIGCERESFVTNVPKRPDCTVLVLPNDGETEVEVNTNIAWNAISTADGYKLKLGTSQGGDDIFSDDVGATTFFDLPENLPLGTTVYATVTPYNELGDAADCNSQSFSTRTDEVVLPTCTQLVMPEANAEAVPVSTNFAWQVVENATGYTVRIGSSAGGNDIYSQDVGASNAIAIPEDLPGDATIYVQVIPYNELGDAEGCVEERFITASGSSIPTCGELVMPVNGSEEVSMSTNFSWSAIDNADGYILRIGTQVDDTDILLEDVGLSNFYDFEEDLPPNTMIFVSIIPYNENGEATSCTAYSFTTAAVPTAPSCTSLILPQNESLNVSTFTNVAWNLVDNAEGYVLSIGSTEGGSEFFEGDVGNSTWYDLAEELPYNTKVYVSITPYNDLGRPEACEVQTFTTAMEPTVPSCSILIAPVDGARSVDPQSTIRWSAVSDADGYRLSLGTTVGGTDLLDDQDLGLITEFFLNGGLPKATQIFVKIVPYNSSGSNLDCIPQSFTTSFASQDIVPFCTSIYEPIDGQSNIQQNAKISWNEVSNADGYLISLGTQPGTYDLVEAFDVGSNTSYDAEDLPIGALIYVTVKPYNEIGSPEGCPETKFITTFVDDSSDKTLFGFSPNADGINDFWVIDGIENYPDNEVTIYNRWGDAIYQTEGYDNFKNVFDGTTNKKTSVGGGKLPEGTYFFNISINGAHNLDKTKGYLVIKR